MIATILIYYLFLLCMFFVIPEAEATDAPALRNRNIRLSRKILVCLIYLGFVLFANPPTAVATTRRPTSERKRRSVGSIFQELGPLYTRRAYRMDAAQFWRLHRLIHDKLGYNFRPPSSSKKKSKTNGARNGLIHTAKRKEWIQRKETNDPIRVERIRIRSRKCFYMVVKTLPNRTFIMHEEETNVLHVRDNQSYQEMSYTIK